MCFTARAFVKNPKTPCAVRLQQPAHMSTVCSHSILLAPVARALQNEKLRGEHLCPLCAATRNCSNAALRHRKSCGRRCQLLRERSPPSTRRKPCCVAPRVISAICVGKYAQTCAGPPNRVCFTHRVCRCARVPATVCPGLCCCTDCATTPSPSTTAAKATTTADATTAVPVTTNLASNGYCGCTPDLSLHHRKVFNFSGHVHVYPPSTGIPTCADSLGHCDSLISLCGREDTNVPTLCAQSCGLCSTTAAATTTPILNVASVYLGIGQGACANADAIFLTELPRGSAIFLSQCQDACDRDVHCLGFRFDAKASRCFLDSGVCDLVPDPGSSTSAFFIDSLGADARSFFAGSGFQCNASMILQDVLPSAKIDLETCKLTCARDSDCEHIAFISSADGQQHHKSLGQCQLYSKAGLGRCRSCFVSSTACTTHIPPLVTDQKNRRMLYTKQRSLELMCERNADVSGTHTYLPVSNCSRLSASECAKDSVHAEYCAWFTTGFACPARMHGFQLENGAWQCAQTTSSAATSARTSTLTSTLTSTATASASETDDTTVTSTQTSRATTAVTTTEGMHAPDAF